MKSGAQNQNGGNTGVSMPASTASKNPAPAVSTALSPKPASQTGVAAAGVAAGTAKPAAPAPATIISTVPSAGFTKPFTAQATRPAAAASQTTPVKGGRAGGDDKSKKARGKTLFWRGSQGVRREITSLCSNLTSKATSTSMSCSSS